METKKANNDYEKCLSIINKHEKEWKELFEEIKKEPIDLEGLAGIENQLNKENLILLGALNPYYQRLTPEQKEEVHLNWIQKSSSVTLYYVKAVNMSLTKWREKNQGFWNNLLLKLSIKSIVNIEVPKIK